MSTSIADLPGPQEEIMENDSEELIENTQFEQETPVSQIDLHDYGLHPQDIDELRGKNNNLSMSIKKKGNKINKRSIFSELNLENIILFIILFMSTTPQSNDLIRRFIGSGYSHMSVSLLKSFLLVILFILIKQFLL